MQAQPGQLGHLQHRGMQHRAHLEQQTVQGQQQQPGLQHTWEQQPEPQQPFSGSCGHRKGRELGRAGRRWELGDAGGLGLGLPQGAAPIPLPLSSGDAASHRPLLHHTCTGASPG